MGKGKSNSNLSYVRTLCAKPERNSVMFESKGSGERQRFKPWLHHALAVALVTSDSILLGLHFFVYKMGVTIK